MQGIIGESNLQLCVSQQEAHALVVHFYVISHDFIQVTSLVGCFFTKYFVLY